ncbi:sigma factor-like helix-turn-helix DNA-binding protein [Actinoplanes sp. NPDC023936]|uniref:sigma factor-like helix-turn-helix DNA-binding protein n=1 Tax=Actinoplanes sp. NPDC023936 TaxID=3154910 RepID=UPI0033E1E376
MVNRLSTDRWRRVFRRRAHDAAQAPLPPSPPPSENTVLLVRAMRDLPPAHRQALVLHYLMDRTIAEIAAETGATAPGYSATDSSGK